MEERRSLERIKPYYYLRVYNEETNKYAGSIVDISLKGFRILSEAPFEPSRIYKFKMRLPEDSFFGNEIKVSAKARWCKPIANQDSYESGFEYTSEAATGIFTIKALVHDLKEKNAF